MPPEWTEDVWRAVYPFITKGLARAADDTYTSEYIWHQVITGQFQLWAGADDTGAARCVMVTHLNRYPTGLIAVQILFLAGEGIGFAEQAHMIGVVKQWARANHAHRIEYSGRRGFLRSCPGGWKEKGITAVMELD